MKFIFLILIISFFGCESKDHFILNTSNHIILEKQIQGFIDSLNSKNSFATQQFREDTVLWWKQDVIGRTKGTPSKITPDLPFKRLKLLQNIHYNCLHTKDSCIYGSFGIEKDRPRNNSKGQYQNDTIGLVFILSKKNKIKGIIQDDMGSIYCQKTKEDSSKEITIHSFYHDNTELTGNDYRPFMETVLDSLGLNHDNSFELMD